MRATMMVAAVLLLTQPADRIQFELMQPDLFAAAGGQPNAWADVDNDGDLDLFVGFAAGKPNRLYRNDQGTFVEIAEAAGVADTTDTRAAAWGDFDGDGLVDLYVGFTRRSEAKNRLYRNTSARGSVRFTDVAGAMSVDVNGETRQVSWIDFDNDGDRDLFVAFRDAPNMLFRNDGGRFASAGKELGVDDPRRTVGAVWFDFDNDGDLDVFTANQNGDSNGLWRNDRTRFVDVAHDLGVDAPGRPEAAGSNGPSVADIDNDGDLDLFVASYGSNFLYRNEGSGTFTEVAATFGLSGGDRATPSRWGDYDNDGRPDLYVSSYVDQPVKEHDFLFHNDGGRFRDVRTAVGLTLGATHGVQWVDFDGDGDLDLSLANNNPNGAHPLYRNTLRRSASTSSVSIPVKDEKGRARMPGTEVRVYAAGTKRLLGMGLFDTGSGYCSQNVMPVHIGLGSYSGRVDVQVGRR
jgi:penicillin G amidase